MLRVTIITSVFNACRTLPQAIESVLAQTYPEIEYIVVDGMSTDGSDECVSRYGNGIRRYIREPDTGIYNAWNKGLAAATGDVIGFLNADDFLKNNTVIEQLADRFADPATDGLYGDLLYIRAQPPHQVVRYWKSGDYEPNRFRWGWMPPHPTVYLRRSCYERFGGFREDFDIAADYELLVRMMVRHRIWMQYLPQVMIQMRVGGKSNASLRNRLRANAEDRKAWLINDMQPPLGLRWTKPLRKIPQYLFRTHGGKTSLNS